MADHKALMRRFYDEVFSKGDVDLVDELATDDLVDHEEGPPGTPEGREGVKAFVTVFREAFPDLKTEVHEMVEEGDLCVARVTFSGTHKGDFMGVPASGKSFSAETIDIVRFDGDRVAEHWGVTDLMALMQQIGAIPG
jgi:steroid delta-isomerase-like uncharacterized protein